MSEAEIRVVASRERAVPREERTGLAYRSLRRRDVRLDPRAVSELIYGSAELDGAATLPFVLELGEQLPSFVVVSVDDFRVVSLKAITIRGQLLTPTRTRATLTIFRRSMLRRVACRLIGRSAAVHGRLTSYVPEELTS